mmetsp:Transcript_13905/g.30139  ORF Transcript_13905/g.30139 Transcript_13905/m.30139 type:complete len:276 (-) Transcript_13905:8-835(-)
MRHEPRKCRHTHGPSLHPPPHPDQQASRRANQPVPTSFSHPLLHGPPGDQALMAPGPISGAFPVRGLQHRSRTPPSRTENQQQLQIQSHLHTLSLLPPDSFSPIRALPNLSRRASLFAACRTGPLQHDVRVSHEPRHDARTPRLRRHGQNQGILHVPARPADLRTRGVFLVVPRPGSGLDSPQHLGRSLSRCRGFTVDGRSSSEGRSHAHPGPRSVLGRAAATCPRQEGHAVECRVRLGACSPAVRDPHRLHHTSVIEQFTTNVRSSCKYKVSLI